MCCKNTPCVFKGLKSSPANTEDDPKMAWCWPIVCDAGPTLNQHRVIVECFLGVCTSLVCNLSVRQGNRGTEVQTTIYLVRTIITVLFSVTCKQRADTLVSCLALELVLGTVCSSTYRESKGHAGDTRIHHSISKQSSISNILIHQNSLHVK